MSTIRLQSSDGEIFLTDENVVNFSELITTICQLLRDGGLAGGPEAVIPLKEVNSTILRKVLQWADFHKNDPVPSEVDEEIRTYNICSWDADFFNVDKETLFELLKAGNYLDSKRLIDVVSKTIANMIKGKTAEENRKTFNIDNDLTPDEENRIHQLTDKTIPDNKSVFVQYKSLK